MMFWGLEFENKHSLVIGNVRFVVESSNMCVSVKNGVEFGAAGDHREFSTSV